jgi:hypothetical protein
MTLTQFQVLQANRRARGAQATLAQPILRGRGAVHMARRHGIQLYSWNDPHGWVPCPAAEEGQPGQGTPAELERAYGVFALPPREQQCVACWVEAP